ncbi:unnamed protein product [Discula destructiva]
MTAAFGRHQTLRITAIVVLILIWTLRLRWSDLTNEQSWFQDGRTESHDSTPSNPNDQWLEAGHALHKSIDLSDPDAPFIGWPLKRTCSEVVEWQQGVVFMCDNNFGGVGNVRNFILTCVRYAIEAGATGLVMPAIRKRKDDDISKYMGDLEFRPFSYLFDEDNFRWGLGENCPQMTIYDHWSDIPNVRVAEQNKDMPEFEVIDAREMSRSEEKDKCDIAELDHHTDRFHEHFKAFLYDPAKGEVPSATHPRIFRGDDWPGMLWEWPVWRDGPELANTFGGLCKINKTIMALGKRTLANMQSYARTHSLDQGEMHKDTSQFFGAHLRTEADVLSYWPTYEEQQSGYLSKAAAQGLTVGYVASGDLSEVDKFVAAARQENSMSVVSKDDLLNGEDLEQLRAMSWDQQGLVDYVVLAGAEYFAGACRSSFSISMAKKRHLQSGGLYSRPYKLRKEGYGRSFIVGAIEQYYDHWIFIWDAMWP